MRRLIALAAVLAASSAAPLAAQRVRDVPARPQLWAGADSNSATVYYMLGVQRLERDPSLAAAAFYWAERLNPGWAHALYGRRVALMMTDRRRLVDYLEDKRSAYNDREVLAIDSLLLRSVERDPYLHRNLDKPLLMMYLRTRENTGQTDGQAEYALQNALRDADSELKAWLDYSDGRFPAAIQGYERALRRASNRNPLRLHLASIHYLSGNYADAARLLGEAINDQRGRDDRDLVRVYESKEVMEFSRAAALERAGDAAGAREAYGRALAEDLAFWPAHRRLSELALAAGDTTTAQSEMALAVELAPAEADLRYEHGVLLVQAHGVLEGVAELQKAAELDPFYAAPHWVLGMVYDQSGMAPEALEQYRAYLSLAPREDANRARAEARLSQLAAAHP